MFTIQFRAQLAAVRLSRIVHRAWASPHFDTAVAVGLGLCMLVLVLLVLAQPPAACSLSQ